MNFWCIFEAVNQHCNLSVCKYCNLRITLLTTDCISVLINVIYLFILCTFCTVFSLYRICTNYANFKASLLLINSKLSLCFNCKRLVSCQSYIGLQCYHELWREWLNRLLNWPHNRLMHFCDLLRMSSQAVIWTKYTTSSPIYQFSG